MTISAGKLRHRVRIEKQDYFYDSNGEVIQDQNTGAVPMQWVEVDTVWAAIEPVSAREFIQSQSMQSQITARITMRYRDGLTADMRLVHLFNGAPRKIYNPQAFLADRESGLEYLTVPCSEGTGEGNNN